MENDRELYELGRKRLADGAIAEAAKAFRESARLRPHFKTLELQGECLLTLGRAAEAVVPLAAATALNRQGRAPALLAEAFLMMGDRDRAAEFAALALERAPGNTRAQRVVDAARSDESAGPRT